MGNTVDRVPNGERCRIRRAITADSYEVGSLKSNTSWGGLLKIYCACDAVARDRAKTGKIENSIMTELISPTSKAISEMIQRGLLRGSSFRFSYDHESTSL